MKIFLATPSHSGKVDINYSLSLFLTGQFFSVHGLEIIGNFVMGSSIDHSRNILVDWFLKSDCTHLLFVDDDMCWSQDLPLRLYQADKDIIGVPYRRKTQEVQFLVKHAEEVEANTAKMNIIEVEEIATGMLMIKRDVFSKMKARSYEADNQQYKLYFKHEILDGQFISEDVYFCRKANQFGIKIHAMVDETIGHVGRTMYAGCYNQIIGKEFSSDKPKADMFCLEPLV